MPDRSLQFPSRNGVVPELLKSSGFCHLVYPVSILPRSKLPAAHDIPAGWLQMDLKFIRCSRLVRSDLGMPGYLWI